MHNAEKWGSKKYLILNEAFYKHLSDLMYVESINCQKRKIST